MSAYRVLLTRRAFGHLQRIDAWWRDNRPAAPELFKTEAVGAFARLAETPLVGASYDRMAGRPARRLLLPQTQYHLYFDVDEAAREVVVMAIWHSARGRPPPIAGR